MGRVGVPPAVRGILPRTSALMARANPGRMCQARRPARRARRQPYPGMYHHPPRHLCFRRFARGDGARHPEPDIPGGSARDGRAPGGRNATKAGPPFGRQSGLLKWLAGSGRGTARADRAAERQEFCQLILSYFSELFGAGRRCGRRGARGAGGSLRRTGIQADAYGCGQGQQGQELDVFHMLL